MTNQSQNFLNLRNSKNWEKLFPKFSGSFWKKTEIDPAGETRSRK